MNIVQVPQLMRNAGRFRQVASVLIKYGVAAWLRHVPSVRVQHILRSRDGKVIVGQPFEVRVRQAIEELGTTFIKFGQILSTRPDIVGAPLAEELAKLQANSPADTAEQVRETFMAEFVQTPEQMFDDFEPVPFASGSIGQVHRATSNGRPVVVKVMHAGIEQQIANDIEILMELARMAENYSHVFDAYQPLRTTKYFCRILQAELDFTRERENLLAFGTNFAAEDDVRFPKCYPELCGRRILTMELLEGTTIAEMNAGASINAEPKDVAKRGARLFLDMVFRDGFFHADPHPGNLMVLDDGRLGIIDVGMVGRMDEELATQLENLLLSSITGDPQLLLEVVTNIGQVPAEVDSVQLRTELFEFVNRYTVQNVKNLDLAQALRDVMEVIHDNQITLNEQASLLIKTLIVLDGTARSLNPDFSLATLMSEYRSEITMRRYHPQRLFRRFQSTQRDWKRLVDILPGDISEILHQAKQGRFDVHLDHRRLDSIVNRLVAGVIAAALFVGSSFLYAQRVPPLWGDYSLPGVVGSLAAVFLGWRVLRAIRFSGSLR